MKSRTVTTVTSNDEYVRLRIFDGELPLEDGRVELVRLDCEQRISQLKRRIDDSIVETVYFLLSSDEPRAIDRLKWINRRNRIDSILKRLRLTGGRGCARANEIMAWLGFVNPTWVSRSEYRKRVEGRRKAQ